MTNHENKRLELLVGSLSDLCVENKEENFVSADSASMAARGAAAGLGIAGLAGGAANALFAAAGGTDSVQYFTGLLDGKRISGRFSKIWFQNGDELECVVDPQSDGSFAVYAVRRPSDQTLWMFPHCSRGRKKHWKYARKMCVVLSLLTTGCMLLFLTPKFGFALWSKPETAFGANIFTVMGIALGLYFSLNTARRWAPFVAVAESIFAAYGYPDPAEVDMPKENSIYWKTHATAGELRKFSPWVYRYIKQN
jgi:hypothetical protein